MTGVLILMCVGTAVFAWVQFYKADKAGTLHPLLSWQRVPSERGWMFWLHSNAARGEHWPLWYWLLSLVLCAMVAAVVWLVVDPWVAAGVFAIPAGMTGYAVYRRLRYGFQGPPRRGSEMA